MYLLTPKKRWSQTPMRKTNTALEATLVDLPALILKHSKVASQTAQ